MDIFYKHQIDHIPHITILYRNQPFQTSPISTNEQTSESLLNFELYPISKIALIFMIDLFKTKTTTYSNIYLLFNVIFIPH